MIVPSSAILVPLLIAFILSALSYYRRDPVRRIACGSFLMAVAPLVFFVVWLALATAGAVSPVVSAAAFAASLAIFALAVWEARRLWAKAKPG